MSAVAHRRCLLLLTVTLTLAVASSNGFMFSNWRKKWQDVQEAHQVDDVTSDSEAPSENRYDSDERASTGDSETADDVIIKPNEDKEVGDADMLVPPTEADVHSNEPMGVAGTSHNRKSYGRFTKYRKNIRTRAKGMRKRIRSRFLKKKKNKRNGKKGIRKITHKRKSWKNKIRRKQILNSKLKKGKAWLRRIRAEAARHKMKWGLNGNHEELWKTPEWLNRWETSNKDGSLVKSKLDIDKQKMSRIPTIVHLANWNDTEQGDIGKSSEEDGHIVSEGNQVSSAHERKMKEGHWHDDDSTGASEVEEDASEQGEVERGEGQDDEEEEDKEEDDEEDEEEEDEEDEEDEDEGGDEEDEEEEGDHEEWDDEEGMDDTKEEDEQEEAEEYDRDVEEKKNNGEEDSRVNDHGAVLDDFHSLLHE